MLEAKLPDLVFDRVGKQLQKMTGIPPKLIFASGVIRFRFFLQPLSDIHAGAAAFAIALLTVSIQALKTAVSNPIHSLRNE
ncbi:MAG: hypothetical protein WBB73_05010 [Candidatus Aminicenantaceae bacterium]